MIQESATRYGANPSAIAALMEIESSFNPGAVSRTGAVGLMQIQRDAHPLYQGGTDPAANIDYGTQYYQQLVEHSLVTLYLLLVLITQDLDVC